MNFLIKQNLLLMIRALYFCVEEQWSNLGRKYDITPAQQHILFILYTSNKESLAPSELSDLGCWHSSTVTRLLKPLSLRGLVNISSDKRPKYKEVKITSSGTKLIEELINAVNKMESFPLEISHLSTNEINNFLNVAQKILDINKSKSFGDWFNRIKIENR